MSKLSSVKIIARPLVIAMLAMVALAGFARAETPAADVPTRIVRAEVYPNLARIVRSGEIRLEKTGPLRLDIVRLSERLDADSFRFTGRGRAKVRIVGTSLERVFYSEDADAQIAVLQKQLDSLKDEDLAYADRLAALGTERKFVESLVSTYAKEESTRMTGAPSTDKWAKAGAFVRERLVAVSREARAVDAERKAHAKKIAEVEEKLNQLNSKRGQWTMVAHVEAEVAEPGDFAVEASYVVYNARWGMGYDVRFDPAKNETEMRCHATVAQGTGEDWEGVTLVLSTAQPQIGGTIPELYPRYIDFYQPAPPPAPMAQAKRSYAMEMDEAAVGDIPAAAPAEEETIVRDAEIVAADVNTVGLATFTAPRPATIPSDEQVHRVFLLSRAWATTTHYEIVPELSNFAYLAAKTTNGFDFPLLEGPASLYQGDAFVGRATIKTTQPGDELLLPFGVDERVQVERERLNRKARETGIIEKSTKLEYRYRITVKNTYQKKSIEARVVERVPTSQHEDISVSIADSTTAGYEKDKEKPGVIVWSLSLAPGTTKEIHLDFDVKHPRGKQIVNLP
ncbi:MAG: mucoidy inhibitor MuiA family protein [Myxococcales bacterium]|nr:MAG: mucoidy inhibitor MuiA family protein [Myxococcales bacterium]